jgi:hypothetical protein
MNHDYIQFEKHYICNFGKPPIKDDYIWVEHWKGSNRHKIGGPAFVSITERSYWINHKKHRLNAPAKYIQNENNALLFWYEFDTEINRKTVIR